MIVFRSSTLSVSATWKDGELQICGHDVGPNTPGGEEYEYYVTVPREDLHLVAHDIGADLTDPMAVLEQLAVHGARIVSIGERAWLKALGVTARFHNWF